MDSPHPFGAGGNPRAAAPPAPPPGDRPTPPACTVPYPTPELAPAPDQPTVREPREDDVPTAAVLSNPGGRYQILEEVARGGMGVVYRARDLDLDRVVALKTLRPDRADVPGDWIRFFAEARAIAQLRHPNIVPIYEFGTYDGKPFFAMAFQGGGTLAQCGDRFQGDPEAVAALMEKVAGAVDFAHSRGILHRDLKPANVLLDESGEPFVSDFGLAKAIDSGVDLTRTSDRPGTPAYMAPEQADGRADVVGPRTDVWALGVILYELLTGRRPFRGTPGEVSDLIRHSDPPAPRSLQRSVDRSLEAVVLRCLNKDPARRYPSARALVEDLRRWRRGEPTEARPEWWPARAFRAVGRHRAVSTTFALLAAFLLFGHWSDAHRDTPERLAPATVESLQEDLAAGRQVRLLNDVGEPVCRRWRTGMSPLTPEALEGGYVAFNGWPPALLELLPDPSADGFRYEADVRVDQYTELGEAGIFFAAMERQTPEGPEQWFGRLSFSEDERIRRVELILDRYHPGLPGKPSHWAHHHARQQPLPPKAKADKPWRHLAVEVTHEKVTAFCDGALVGDLDRDDCVQLARHLMSLGPRKPLPPAPDWPVPRGALGLYSASAAASFRNVVVTPFRP